MGHQHRRGVPSLLCWHGRGVLCLCRHHSLHPLHVWPTAGNLQGPDHWSRCSSGKNVDFYIILQLKVMKEWVDMENFYRDSTRFHHEEAVWIISCWICFWLWVYTCIVIESIQISCYWPYRPSCFKYILDTIFTERGTWYIYICDQIFKNQAPVTFSGEWTWARLYGRQKSVHNGRL